MGQRQLCELTRNVAPCFQGEATVGMRVLTLRFSFKQELEESNILTFY